MGDFVLSPQDLFSMADPSLISDLRGMPVVDPGRNLEFGINADQSPLPAPGCPLPLPVIACSVSMLI